jgi:hypothetical protein
MDNGAGLPTFVEISFGVNLLTGAFEGFRGFIVLKLKSQNYIRVSELQTLEVVEDGKRHFLPILVAKIKSLNCCCDRIQATVCKASRAVAIIFACLCVAVAYFDLLGKWNFVLILTYPIYILASLGVFGFFWARAQWFISQHKAVLNMYQGASANETRLNVDNSLESLE